MPETTDIVAINVIPAIRLTWVTNPLSMPNTNESPEATCCTPNPNEVANPNTVAKTAKMSMTSPTHE